MNIGMISEVNESRTSLTPAVIKKLLAIEGVSVIVESNANDLFSDEKYAQAGAQVVSRDEVLTHCDILLLLNPLERASIKKLKPNTMLICHLDPYNNFEYIKELMDCSISSISMEMIPRTTLAQKMDSQSSQASLAGYAGVIQGARLMNEVFPMMMTPSGTIPPARVFVIGAGVAGLQAIATAKRLGARVEAFDTRPSVKEQVSSLGAKFIEIDLGDTSETSAGYAKALSEEQIRLQQEAMLQSCAAASLVITTARVFGKKSPILVTKEMIAQMKPGSVIVDLAAGTGGNVEGGVPDQITEMNGVKISSIVNMPGLVPLDASAMYASNLFNLLSHFYNKESKEFDFRSCEIAQACVITYGTDLVNETMTEFYKEEGLI